MSAARIRVAAAGDAAQVAAIYAPIVERTVISFEFDAPAADEMRRRITETLARWPWLVCERAGNVLGYAYAGRHRARAAYQWSADVSVYVDAAARRGGVGRALYASLLAILVVQGYVNAYAGITLPNPASVGLHEALGFRPIGVYRGVGYKFGAWHDVGWWHLALRERPDRPAPPLAFPDVVERPGFEEALRSGEGWLRV